MWMPILGLIAGLLIGTLFPFSLPLIKAKYLAITALSAIDFIFLGFSTKLNNHFNTNLFIIEFLLTTMVAIGLVYLGDIMSTDLFVAITIVYSARIFHNLSILNHKLFFQKQ